MSLPKTFKAAVIDAKGAAFKLVDRQLEAPKAGQILVKVLACGVCHSDTMVTNAMVPLPKIPGHEIIGDVAAVGPNEVRWKVGERVGAGWHGGHCGHCEHCREGEFIVCKEQNVNGIMTDGGYAEYVILRTEAVVSVPADMDPAEAAPLLCAGVTTFNSLRNMNVHPGDIVAVQGIGGLGHLGIQFANKMGYRVVALSSSASKASLAKELGAHEYIDGSSVNQGEALMKLGGAKVVMCTAPSPDVINKLYAGIKGNGTLLILAIAQGITVDCVAIVSKQISVRGWASGTAADSEDTLEFAKLQNVKCLVKKFKLSEVNEAFDFMLHGKGHGRAVLVF